MEEDRDLKEAIEECAKIMQDKCGGRPFLLVAAKADVGFKSDEDERKGLATGTASFMYVSRPKLKRDGLSKLLLDTLRHGISQSEKKIMEEEGS